MTKQDENRALVLELYSRMEARDFERCKALVAPELKTDVGGNVLDREAWAAMGQTFMNAFKESVGVAAQVADGFWIIATKHHPGGSHNFPEINNRCLIFRLIEHGAPMLLVINGVDASAIEEVKRVERETGLSVRYVLSPGGGHHVLLPAWVGAFPLASVLVGPDRIPRTASGKKLLAMSRVSTFDPTALLPQFKGQLEFVSFRGLFGAPDRSPGEGGADGVVMLLNMMFSMLFRMKDPVDELWTYHVATRTLIAGENLGWMYPKAVYSELPKLLKGMIKPDSLYLFKDARKVADARTVDACWREILAWPADTVLTYHDPAGHGFRGDGSAALEAAVREQHQLL